MAVCETRGFLALIMMWLVSKKKMTGAEIALELEKRKGSRPSPGTIYPVLKYLNENNLIKEIKGKGKLKRYEITKKGREEIKIATRKFVSIFNRR